MARQPVLIRLAVPSEKRALEALQRRASLNNPGDREALLANPDAIEVPSEQIESGGVLVAEVSGAAVGFAAVVPREDGDVELDALFVAPELWGRGIGAALVDRCLSEARVKGALALHVVGNPHAEGFYRKCGFLCVGETQTRFGVGLLMRQDLY